MMTDNVALALESACEYCGARSGVRCRSPRTRGGAWRDGPFESWPRLPDHVHMQRLAHNDWGGLGPISEALGALLDGSGT